MSDHKNHNLNTTMVYLDGVPYRVEDYPLDYMTHNDPSPLKKGIAYRYVKNTMVGNSMLTSSYLLPYRGFVKDDFSYKDAKVGIWCKKISKDRNIEVIVRPRTIEEKLEYQVGKEKDLVAATLNYDFTIDQFSDELTQSDIGTDVYLPPIHIDDDPLNMLLKMAIRLKGAPFEPYANRLKALAVDKRKGVEGANIVNNSKRGLKLNRTMSPTKFMQFSDTWQVEPAIIIRDLPQAMHKMSIPEGKMLVIYPNGVPFDINQDDLIDIADMVTDACSLTMSNDTHSSNDEDDES